MHLSWTPEPAFSRSSSKHSRAAGPWATRETQCQRVGCAPKGNPVLGELLASSVLRASDCTDKLLHDTQKELTPHDFTQIKEDMLVTSRKHHVLWVRGEKEWSVWDPKWVSGPCSGLTWEIKLMQKECQLPSSRGGPLYPHSLLKCHLLLPLHGVPMTVISTCPLDP